MNMKPVEPAFEAPKNRHKLGILLMVIPFVLMFFVFASFAMVNATMMSTSPSQNLIVINFVLGVLGMIALAGLVVGIPLGVYFLISKEKDAVPVGHSDWQGEGSVSVEKNIDWGGTEGCFDTACGDFRLELGGGGTFLDMGTE